MRSYAYSVLMLLHFLLARETDLRSVTETDLRECRLWRQGEAEEVAGDAAWDRDWAAIEVDAAATVIAALIAVNTALREQIAQRSAVVIPLDRTHAARE